MRWLVAVSSTRDDGAEVAADLLRAHGFACQVLREWAPGSTWPVSAEPVRVTQGGPPTPADPFEARKLRRRGRV